MPSSRRRSVWAPQMVSSTLGEDTDLDREIDAIVKLLKEKGPLGAPTIRRELETRFWGPGRLRARPGGGAQARAGAPKQADAYAGRRALQLASDAGAHLSGARGRDVGERGVRFALHRQVPERHDPRSAGRS